jgi:hypothetical protein
MKLVSKKRFTDGMDSIFGAAEDETLQEDSPLLSSEKAASLKKQKESRKRSSGKDFSEDLQAFLQDAFDESLEQQLKEKEEQPTTAPNTSVKKRRRRPAGDGLDALIRSTVNPEPMPRKPAPVKRVTLTIDPQKLEKLKHIARSRRAYLKDVIDEIVADYLSRYEREE